MAKKKDFFKSAEEVMSKIAISKAKKKVEKIKKKKRPKYNLKSRITSALRRIWFYGPQRKEAAKIAKERLNRCTMCGSNQTKLQIDHIVPVVPVTGFDNWQSYIDRLFCPPEGLRAICEPCHKVVTTISREIRKNNNKKS